MLAWTHMKNTIRQIYFYAATLIFLIMSVIGTVSLLNLGMKTYILTKADKAYGPSCDDTGIQYYEPRPVPMAEPVKEGQPAVKELTAEEKTERKAACEKTLADQKAGERQRELAQNLSMVLVAAPLFWVHFKWVQKEREKEIELAAKEEKKA
jgi:hypothetical protein